jgi:prepilin-type N-terminal cleavage/methylation domain-containing protein
MKFVGFRQDHARRCRGLTLVELMMALSITAMVAVAIGGMLSAVAYGTDADRDVRALVARGKMVSLRANAALRGSRMVLAAGQDTDGTWAVLWQRDLDGNGEPSLLEIRRLDYDASAETLDSYTAPAAAADVLYSTGSDFEAITEALMGTAAFPAERWANDVADFDLALEFVNPRLSRTLSYRIDLTSGPHTETSVGTVLLRNQP